MYLTRFHWMHDYYRCTVIKWVTVINKRSQYPPEHIMSFLSIYLSCRVCCHIKWWRHSYPSPIDSFRAFHETSTKKTTQYFLLSHANVILLFKSVLPTKVRLTRILTRILTRTFVYPRWFLFLQKDLYSLDISCFTSANFLNLSFIWFNVFCQTAI